ncbi:ankyrin repeat-containing domain protein [Chaetomidium leptoderma]|uniref:Ankyrin repeat-containing domain protein n=1 Tax=Chaetomidium leptoderma TaxID=669021 RepID=A0AAN6VIJ2_9PEZI|nr:ankyrin repeat-containing domain protein [Chaetomidium leptoderma]
MAPWPWTKTKAIHKAVTSNDHAKLQQLLANKSVHVNAENANGATALHIAASLHDLTALKALLAHASINPNAQERNGKTPLHLAISAGLTDAVQALLEDPRTDVNLADRDGRSPLHFAVDVKHHPFVIVSLVVKTPGVNCNAQDRRQRTALSCALDLGLSETVIALVSGRETVPEVAVGDADGGTASHKAVERASSALVHLVKGQDRAVLNAQNKSSEAVLHVAARLNDTASLKLLVQAGADLDVRRGSDGATPLHIAAQHRSHEFVKHWRFFDPPPLRKTIFAKDNDGNTPLHLAARHGDSEMVAILLDLDKARDENTGQPIPGPDPIEVAQVNNKGEAAVELAACHGHVDTAIRLLQAEGGIASEEVRLRHGEAVFRLLLHTHDGSTAVDEVHEERAIALFAWAAQEGVFDLIKSHRHHVHSSALESSILQASERGYTHVVQYLVEEGIDPNTCEEPMGTALAVASEHGHIELMKFLLSLEGLNPNLGVPGKDTPLMRAIRNRSAAAISLLLSDEVLGGGGLSLDTGDILLEGSTTSGERWDSNPLLLASELGDHDTVALLVRPNLPAQITLNVQGRNGETSLALACRKGHWRVVEVLLQSRSWTNLEAVVDAKDYLGVTPFSRACASGVPKTVELFLRSDLIQRKLVDPNSGDRFKITPLARACAAGAVDVVQLIFDSYLLKDHLFDPDARDYRGRSPLAMACWSCNWKIVKLFVDYSVRDDATSLVDFGVVDIKRQTLLDLTIANNDDSRASVVLVLLDGRLVARGLAETQKAYEWARSLIRDTPQCRPLLEPLVQRLKELGLDIDKV